MRRWVGAWVAASTVVAAMVLFAPAAQAGELDNDELTSELGAWVPEQLPGAVIAVAPAPIVEPSLGGCLDGQTRQWTADDVVVASLIWMRCGTPEAAVERLSGVWADSVLFPDPSPAALGEGVELTAAAIEADGHRSLYRLWSQSDYYIAVGRACGANDAECAARSAADAVTVRDLSTSTLNPLTLATPSPDQPLANFVPTDDAGWMIKYSRPADTTVSGGTQGRCGDGVATLFADEQGDTLQVFWVDCGQLATAQAFVIDQFAAPDSDGLLPFMAAGQDGVSRTELPVGVPAIARWWVEGTVYLQVTRSCGVGEENCAQLTADYARAIEPLLPGSPEQLTNWNNAIWAVVILFGVPIATYLLILIPRRIIARRRQREEPPNPLDASGAAFVSVDDLVGRVRRSRIIRRTIIVVAGSILSLVLIVWVLLTGEFVAQVLALFVAPILIFFAVSWILELIWRPHRLIRPARSRGRLSLLAIAGTALRGLAVFLAAAVIMLYVLLVLLTWSSAAGTAESVRAKFADQIEAAEGAWKLLPIAMSGLWELYRSGWIVVLFPLAVAVPIFFVYLLDRVGRRLARRSLQDTLAQDTRPYFLYLRGFDEDRLRIDESLGRRGFLELFSLFGRPRFEEVLAEHLSAFGPVIAISGSKTRLQDLGAAKVSLGGDRWQEQVRAWVGGARAIVLSATPSEVRAGLEWEIEYLASREQAPPVILVLAPWPRAERERRWEGFLATASGHAMFRGLAEHAPPSATNLLTYSPGRGWTSYGAMRRWDWSYAASILTAVEAGDLDQGPNAATTEAQREPEPA